MYTGTILLPQGHTVFPCWIPDLEHFSYVVDAPMATALDTFVLPAPEDRRCIKESHVAQ